MNHKPSRSKAALVRGLGLLVVLVLGALWAPAPALADDTFSYTVQSGDTLYKLSVRFETTVGELVALNDIRNPDLIFVDQVLLIPTTDGAGSPPAPSMETGGGPLSFTWERIGVRNQGGNYLSKLRVTAAGGQPPYAYYHDGVVLGEEASVSGASATFEIPSRRGRPKPGSVGVADATGRYVMAEYWLRDPCNYPPGVEITRPKEEDVLGHSPRNFNIEWEPTVDPPPDGYWIEIQVRRNDRWEPFQTYRYDKGGSTLFFVPDPFPGDFGGRLRMWGYYGECEANDETPWRYFWFKATD
jgi:hypothetical protein